MKNCASRRPCIRGFPFSSRLRVNQGSDARRDPQDQDEQMQRTPHRHVRGSCGRSQCGSSASRNPVRWTRYSMRENLSLSGTFDCGASGLKRACRAALSQAVASRGSREASGTMPGGVSFMRKPPLRVSPCLRGQSQNNPPRHRACQPFVICRNALAARHERARKSR